MNEYIIACIAICIVAMLIYMAQSEDFATSRDKAEKINDWFNSTTSHNYNSYRKALNDNSNIVEYEDALQLFQTKNLTISSIEKII